MITRNFNFKADGNTARKGFPGEKKEGAGEHCLNLTFHDVNHMQGGGVNPPSKHAAINTSVTPVLGRRAVSHAFSNVLPEPLEGQ